MSVSRNCKMFFLVVFLLFPLLAQAETRYVSDVLVISIRTEPTRSASIIGHLRTGKAMDVLEDNGEGFLLIRTDNGEQGWVQSRYTTTDLPKSMVIKQLKNKIASLEKKIAGRNEQQQKLAHLEEVHQAELKQLKAENEDLTTQLLTMEQAVTKAQDQFKDLQEKSKGVTEVYGQRDELQAQNNDMRQKITFLEAENADLVQTGRILWFLAGFGVFLFGWLMGRMGRKQRHSSITL